MLHLIIPATLTFFGDFHTRQVYIHGGGPWRTVERPRVFTVFPYVHTRPARAVRPEGSSTDKNEHMWIFAETSAMNDKRLPPELQRYLGTICRICNVIETRSSKRWVRRRDGLVTRRTRRCVMDVNEARSKGSRCDNAGPNLH